MAASVGDMAGVAEQVQLMTEWFHRTVSLPDVSDFKQVLATILMVLICSTSAFSVSRLTPVCVSYAGASTCAG